MGDEPNRSVTMQELPEMRRKTEAVSQLLRNQVTAHLETLRPLLAPERVFGKYAAGKVEVNGADRALAEVQQLYRPFASKPYDLPRDFDTNWLTLVGSALQLHPWEYLHPVQGKPITMTSPLRWMVNYRANYTLSQVRNALAGTESVRPEYLRQFVVNALVLQVVLARNSGLVQLFADLRYELKTEKPGELQGLQVVTVASCLPSFRPPDDLIAAATAFSGVPSFIELADLEAVKSPKDTLKEKLEELTR